MTVSNSNFLLLAGLTLILTGCDSGGKVAADAPPPKAVRPATPGNPTPPGGNQANPIAPARAGGGGGAPAASTGPRATTATTSSATTAAAGGSGTATTATTATTTTASTTTATTTTTASGATASGTGGGGLSGKELAKAEMAVSITLDTSGKGVGDMLLAAAHKGNLETFEAFKELGTKSDLLGNKMETELKKTILKQVDATNKNVLHLAASEGKDELVKVLLSLGAALSVDLNTKDVQGFYPLHLSAYYGHEKAIGAFLESALDKDVLLNQVDNVNLRPVDYAAIHGRRLALEEFYKADNDIFNKENLQGNNALFKSIVSDTSNANTAIFIIQRMTKEALSFKKKDNDRNVLHVAAEKGKAQVVKELLARQKTLGVDLNTLDKHKFSPFFLSAYFGPADTAEAFLNAADDKIALLAQPNEQGFRAVDYAGGRGHDKVLEVFYQADNQIFNKKNTKGKTALFEAVTSKDTSKEAVAFILKNMKPSLRNECETDDPCKVYAAIHAAANADVSADVLKLLVDSLDHAQLNAEDNYGWTPLRYMIRSTNEAKIKIMLESGKVEINKVSNGETPLQYAISMQIIPTGTDNKVILQTQLGVPLNRTTGNGEQGYMAEPKDTDSWAQKYIYEVYARLKTESRRIKLVNYLLTLNPGLQGAFAVAAEKHDIAILTILDKANPNLKNESGWLIGGNKEEDKANGAVRAAIEFAISEEVSYAKENQKHEGAKKPYGTANEALDLVEQRTITTLDFLKTLGLPSKAFSENILDSQNGQRIIWGKKAKFWKVFKDNNGHVISQGWYMDAIERHLRKLSTPPNPAP